MDNILKITAEAVFSIKKGLAQKCKAFVNTIKGD
jgi:hypothetical protein